MSNPQQQRRGGSAAGAVRKLGLVLVVRRLQPGRGGEPVRPALPQAAGDLVPAPGARAAAGAVSNRYPQAPRTAPPSTAASCAARARAEAPWTLSACLSLTGAAPAYCSRCPRSRPRSGAAAGGSSTGSALRASRSGRCCRWARPAPTVPRTGYAPTTPAARRCWMCRNCRRCRMPRRRSSMPTAPPGCPTTRCSRHSNAPTAVRRSGNGRLNCATAIRGHWREPGTNWRADIAGIEGEQYAFHVQWSRLRAYARERGVRLFGDLPFYVAPSSAETWAHRGLFQLSRRRRAGGRRWRAAGLFLAHRAALGQPAV